MLNLPSPSASASQYSGASQTLSPLAPGLADAFSRRFMPVTDARAQGSGAFEAGTLGSRQEAFSQIIAREANRTLPTKEARAKETARQFVASSLVEPILKQMRAGSDVPPPFGASQAEKQFRTLMDTQVARNIVKRANWPVVDRIAQDLLQRSSGVSA